MKGGIIVKGLKSVGNPLINEGKANFIQVYINNNAYFRAGEEKNGKLLENFLNEFNLSFLTESYEGRGCFSESIQIPKKKSQDYQLIGAGEIQEGYFIKENMKELDEKIFFSVGGYCEVYHLYPHINHFSKILKHFEYPLIFVGSNSFTEEERGFMEFYGNDLADFEQKIDEPTDLSAF